MALDCGPDSAVWTPGERARELSSEVAYVSVVKGFDGDRKVDEVGT